MALPALAVAGLLGGGIHQSACAAAVCHQQLSNIDALRAILAMDDLASIALVTAGVSDEVAPGVLAAVAGATSTITSLGMAREEHSLAIATDAEIRAEVQSGGLTPERAAALNVAQVRVVAATVSLEAAEEDIRDLAIAALIDRVGTENAALAQRAASNLSRRVPDAWKVLDLPSDSPVWQTLESAWFKAQRGLPDAAFTQAERDALAAAQSDPTVALAQQRLDANLAGVEAAWAQFIAEQMAGQEPPM